MRRIGIIGRSGGPRSRSESRPERLRTRPTSPPACYRALAKPQPTWCWHRRSASAMGRQERPSCSSSVAEPCSRSAAAVSTDSEVANSGHDHGIEPLPANYVQGVEHSRSPELMVTQLHSATGGLLVNASTVIAVCATVIAGASLGVSVYEARATRAHNRRSVQPLLVLWGKFSTGATSGLGLRNSGLGPAKVTDSKLTLDGVELGDFSKSTVDKLRHALSFPVAANTLDGQPFLETDYEQFLLSVDSYDMVQHPGFYELIESRLRIEITYDSIYGGEQLTAVYSTDQSSDP
jgi:hypothetical protein